MACGESRLLPELLAHYISATDVDSWLFSSLTARNFISLKWQRRLFVNSLERHFSRARWFLISWTITTSISSIRSDQRNLTNDNFLLPYPSFLKAFSQYGSLNISNLSFSLSFFLDWTTLPLTLIGSEARGMHSLARGLCPYGTLTHARL